MEIRRARPGEGQELRELRLAALLDAPWAFGSSFEREEPWPPVRWEGRLAPESGAVFVAVEGDRWVAMAGGYLDRERPRTAALWGMWVSPANRGHGLARALVDAVTSWAREQRATILTLSVTDRAQAAAALYEALDFVPTGERRPLESDPQITQIILERALT